MGRVPMTVLLDDELKETVDKWLKANVTPLITRHEADCTFPFEILDGLKDFGYLGGRIPEADGGFDLFEASTLGTSPPAMRR